MKTPPSGLHILREHFAATCAMGLQQSQPLPSAAGGYRFGSRESRIRELRLEKIAYLPPYHTAQSNSEPRITEHGGLGHVSYRPSSPG
ncbi:hypothetical protein [Rhizobium leguminosarum]|uniref:hypothetical protein n=1 Tax=Rhizobium leguminosarum TaxID=384 RepID=UPI0015FD4650|nr:hypothetical protein [Rhizobium leguminosarum]MBA9036029.1 hypothetical protein [Rhizobium leguminosarum]